MNTYERRVIYRPGYDKRPEAFGCHAEEWDLAVIHPGRETAAVLTVTGQYPESVGHRRPTPDSMGIWSHVGFPRGAWGSSSFFDHLQDPGNECAFVSGRCRTAGSALHGDELVRRWLNRDVEDLPAHDSGPEDWPDGLWFDIQTWLDSVHADAVAERLDTDPRWEPLIAALTAPEVPR